MASVVMVLYVLLQMISRSRKKTGCRVSTANVLTIGGPPR